MVQARVADVHLGHPRKVHLLQLLAVVEQRDRLSKWGQSCALQLQILVVAHLVLAVAPNALVAVVTTDVAHDGQDDAFAPAEICV